jgi:hypothetical protein
MRKGFLSPAVVIKRKRERGLIDTNRLRKKNGGFKRRKYGEKHKFKFPRAVFRAAFLATIEEVYLRETKR